MDAQFASAKAAPCTLSQFSTSNRIASVSRFKRSVLFIYKMEKECPPPVSVSPNSANWPHTESAARTVLIGRSRIQIAFVVLREGSGLFCQRATVISSGDGGGAEKGPLFLKVCACVLQVTILRGKDGYGFTICSDSPVRVQAVDPGESGISFNPDFDFRFNSPTSQPDTKRALMFICATSSSWVIFPQST